MCERLDSFTFFPYVSSVIPTDDYKLKLTFENGEKKIFDVRPLLSQRPWTSLKDLDFFMKAKVLGCSVVWDMETDIALEIPYQNSIPETVL